MNNQNDWRIIQPIKGRMVVKNKAKPKTEGSP
ncbi:unnamed protein product [Gemmata massiliana]|uniref:Uncharacterized protein n=1 Tax=Gemmata massiliana TaxID=1210884 RepID=A0A6P2CU92_9BACT|nr:unnamed protein product [Gemmata massiliana]